MRSQLWRVLVIGAVIAMFSAPVRSQDSDRASVPKILVKEVGWRVPGKEWIDLHQGGANRTTDSKMDGVTITARRYSVPESDRVTLPTFKSGPKGLIFQYFEYQANVVTVYSVRNRVFEYEVTASLYSCSKEGECGYVAIGSHFEFVDSDGDGIFETMSNSPETLTHKLLPIPDWVKGVSQKASK